MHSSDGKASGVEPRPSTRIPGRRLDVAWGGDGGDDDDDDYDLNANAVSDGFRPSQAGPTTTPSQSPPPAATTPQPLLPVAAASASSDAFGRRPLSTSKPPRAHDSLTLRNDRSSFARRRQSGAPVLPSISTGAPLMEPESPYRGPSDPSHPYLMYPQRTSSSTTASTAPHVDGQSYDGPRGPTHPYALYTQNTAAAEEATQQHIPVGFTSMGNSYQRQIGPDGEEAGDLIGPLGHLEELPPYTRYPEESYAGRKPPEPAPVDASDSPVHPIPGAGGLGIATRDPEFSSNEDDLTLSRSRPTSRSEASQHEINTAARDVSEKPKLNKWQRRARKKLWGVVPCWAICLLVVCIIAMGTVMGAVIGTVFAKHGKSKSWVNGQLQSAPTAAPTGVQLLPGLPPNLPSLATGSYTLPLLETSQSSKSCFNNPTQAQAWSCDTPLFCSMNISRVPNAKDTSDYQLTLAATYLSSAKFIWGTQPPVVPDPQPLTLVSDTFEQGRGPAWWLKVTYEKKVIVPEDKFPPRQNSKRSSETLRTDIDPLSPKKTLPPPWLRKKSAGAKDGDRPWICTWPNTTLEIFIYPSQNASAPPPPPPPEPSTTLTPKMPATDGGFPGSVPAYPLVVKFLERRQSSDEQATARCRQVRIVDNDRDLAATDSNGKPIEEMIIEKEDRRSTNTALPSDVPEMTGCGCLWWST